jgi:hypothetical protein
LDAIRGALVFGQPLPKTADQIVYRPSEGFEVIAPQLRKQIIASETASRIRDKNAEEVEFRCG